MSQSHFKSQLINDRLKFMNPQLTEIMNEMIQWLTAKGVFPVITETVTTLKEDAALGRKSSTHREGRAFDLRTRDWPAPLKKEFEDYFNKKYGSLGALGATTLQPTFLVFHDIGWGEHFHVQLNKTYAMKVPKDIDGLKTA